jgi:type IV pilus assembly protein PilW
MRRQHRPLYAAIGLTLIELLVSMVVGLIVILAAMASYLGSASAARVADAQAQMNEDAQAALAILSQQFRMAGNNPIQSGRTPEFKRNPVYRDSGPEFIPNSLFHALRGCDGRFGDMDADHNIDTFTCPQQLDQPDAIAVTYEADRYNTPTSASASGPSDCIGEGAASWSANVQTIGVDGIVTPQTVSFHVIEHRFFIGTSTAITTPSLYCMNREKREPLVENVVDLQLSYGVVPPDVVVAEGNIAGYLSATELMNAPALGALTEAERWSRVAAVRICVVMQSQRPVAGSASATGYVRCDGSLAPAGADGHLRRAYHATVALRNRM